jgi:hypothetical protein
MKPKLIIIFGVLLIPACLRAQAQYSIDWFKLSGGGGTSTGGVYTVGGTIGQPDAGTLSGGNYTLQGGFWGMVSAIQTPGAPYLHLVHTNGVVTVYWEKTAAGFVLDQAPTLTGSPPLWSQVPSSQYQTNAEHCFITVTAPLPSANRFYRLRQTNP